MKLSQQVTPEQQAQVLWSKFNSSQSEKFWQQYQALIDQSKAPHTPPPPHPETSTLITPKKKIPVFRPSSSLYGKIVVLSVIAGCFLVFFVKNAGQNTEYNFFIIPTLLLFGMAFYEARNLNVFRLEDQFLGIYNKFSFTHERIAWKDITSMSIVEGKGKEDYRNVHWILLLKTQFGKIYQFRIPMSHEDQHKFISLIKAKNIPFEDTPDKGDFWAYLMDQI